MRKHLLLLLVLVLMGGFQLFAQYPIPSYGVQVNSSAFFLENTGTQTHGNQAKEKRKIRVTTTLPNKDEGICRASVWVFSKDGQDILGPYIMVGEASITIGIDDREWGVLVRTEGNIIVNVWIEGDLKMYLPQPKTF